jgi:NTE family protein
MRFFKKDRTPPFDYRTLYKYLPNKYRLKVGLALGSGGARGLTHLGVIKALTDAGIKIEFVSGASVGALVGAFLAAGKLERLVQFASSLTVKESLKMADVMFPTSGLIEGKKIEEFLRTNLGTVRMEDLAVPFACVATDFYTGREVVITRGDLVTAVRASISIPGVFKPVAVDGMLLVDGGVVNPVPVQVVRDLGAEYIVAVDICPEVAKKMTIKYPIADTGRVQGKAGRDAAKLPNIFEIIMGSITIMESQIVDMRMRTESPDIIVKPAVEDIGTYDFHRYQEGVTRGESAAGLVISRISRYVRTVRTTPTKVTETRPAGGTLN